MKSIYDISILIYYSIDLININELKVLKFLLNRPIKDYNLIRLLTRFFF